jgi:hypothetical protein
MNTRSLSRVMARSIFSADAAKVAARPDRTVRYEARPEAQGNQWLVWDTRTDSAVFGEANKTRHTAQQAAKVLNQAYETELLVRAAT